MYTSAEIQLLREADPGAVLPGIDTPVGNLLPASSLINYATLSQASNAPIRYLPAQNQVIVTQAGAVLSGINFGSAEVIIEANDVTIENCTFTGPTGNYSIQQQPTATGAIVENCSFTGSKTPGNVGAFITADNDITIENNSFIDSGSDAVHVEQGTVSGNFFSGSGYEAGAHSDAIYVFASTGATTITDNFIDWTDNPDAAVGTVGDIRITAEFGVDVNDVNVSGNYLLGGTFAVYVGKPGDANTVTNVSITDNDIGFQQYGDFDLSTPATVSDNTIFDYTNSTYSTQALAAYQAAVSSLAAADGISTPSGVMTNFATGVLDGVSGSSTSATNFVPGSIGKNLWGGQGVNIFTYLAISDSPTVAVDGISNFDPAKDVIDLSRIDANVSAPGLQQFNFIGTNAFSGAGGQVRYQQDPTNDVTYVEADLDGDYMTDFEIKLPGLLTLTAANFALTPAQSATDTANAGAISAGRVSTPAGSLIEDAYTNVSGRNYGSFEAFYSNSTSRAADDLNLSSTTNELILYENNLTVTRGANSESLKGATVANPLSWDPTETIDASPGNTETFVFGPNFGRETLMGLMTTGTAADTIQLATSSFSYLTPAMSQAQDLAAVLAHARNAPSGLTISDSYGDTLTLAGVSAPTIAANPGVFRFA